MAPAPADKKPVKVTIFNQTYTIVSADDPEEIERLAQTVDELMRIYAKAGNIDATRIAVLASLHLADQIRNTERELSALKQRVDAKSQHFSLLLDQVID
jgi:cell division protein ZapA (FtsZ GTPase activity inhibitor)